MSRTISLIALVLSLLLTMCVPFTLGVQLVPDATSSFASADPHDMRYIVTILDGASKAAAQGQGHVEDSAAASSPASAASSRLVRMRGRAGQVYECRLPQAAAQEVPGRASTLAELDQAAAGQVQAGQQVEAEGSPGGKGPQALLGALAATCLYRQEGLWMYEMCYKKHVRQFRQEGGGAREDFSCGQYTGDEQQTETILEDSSASGHSFKYITHSFAGGATCHLTGQPRTAEVRFACGTGGARENVITSVKEFPACNYVVTVRSPLLCSHPAFEPQPERVEAISCTLVGLPGGVGQQEQQQEEQLEQQAAGGEGRSVAPESTVPGEQHGASAVPSSGNAADSGHQEQQQRPAAAAAAAVDADAKDDDISEDVEVAQPKVEL